MAFNFLKKGKEAQEELAKADIQSDIRQSRRDVRRFRLKPGTEAQITFLDGALSSDGLIDTTRFWEHRVFLAGSWNNFFPCTAEQEPCPICAIPKHFASLVSLFTVIDHSKYTDRNNKVWTNQRKLFVAKRDTMKLLQMKSAKRGGLKGWAVNVLRVGDKSAEVGTDFEFVEQRDLASLPTMLGIPPTEAVPFDYADGSVVKYLTADQLRSLGIGAPLIGAFTPTGVNGSGGVTGIGQSSASASEAMDRDL